MTRLLLVLVCAWELAALTLRWPPTITETVRTGRGTVFEPVLVIVVCGLAGWFVWHLILEGR